MSKTAFLVEGLTKEFGKRQVLKDVNLEIEKGEIFGVMGPSGAGKTTLLRILNLLESPSAGKVYFDGQDVSTLSGDELLKVRRRMALVIQGAPLFNQTVYENIAYGLNIRDKKRISIDKKVKEALDLVGMSGYENRNAKTLSGGEAQRVAFAMASVFKPDVLLLDEPTANLDPINEKIIEDIILKINRQGISIILSTHKQKEAIDLADHIAVIENGEILQTGSPDGIFYRPTKRFVAAFTGTENILPGEITKIESLMTVDTGGFNVEVPLTKALVGDEVFLCIRPDEIMIMRRDRPINPKHKNILEGRISSLKPYGGAVVRLNIKVKSLDLTADVPRHVARKINLKEGEDILISLPVKSCNVVKY